MQTHQDFLQGAGKIMFQMNFFFVLIISFSLLQLFCPLVILWDEWNKPKNGMVGETL
jgi:hypothetical protein